MIDKKTKQPYINVWFGNFYKPAYDDKEFVANSIKALKQWGFNSILLDSKAWADFQERFEGGEASPYVAMQEFMQQEIKKNDMSHEFLALYLNGDNLYPNIRFSPPVYGESVTDQYGRDGKWYRYWSGKAKDSMVEHVRGLLHQYHDNYVEVEIQGKTVRPICSMWDPIVAPSFDEEGKSRYLDWLAGQYDHSIAELNQAYGINAEDFGELTKEEYWYFCKYPEDITCSLEDIQSRNPKSILWSDNMKWKKRELVLYFADMKERLKAVDPEVFLCPNLAQWSYFLNIDGSMLTGVGMSDLWDTAVRGIDIYEIAPSVDSCHFITVPVTPFGDPNAYVVSCQHSMMRAMNDGREFIGGIYWGRFLYNDIYEFLTPCEIVGSMVANGISGYSSYGMCGLDDGGVLHRMDGTFTASLSKANEWARKVIPLLGKRRKQAAVLFPSAMAAFETMQVRGNKERRLDLLGWYQLCCDAGYDTDVIDINGIEKACLEEYQVLIIPANDCYWMETHKKAEEKLCEWVKNGGILLHGPQDYLLEAAFGIKGENHASGAIYYKEGVMTQGERYEAFEGEIIAPYMKDNKGCVVRNQYGRGNIYSFGFYYGYSYTAKVAPHVPREQMNNELYPIPLMKSMLLKDILENHGVESNYYSGKLVETAVFTNGIVVVNHNSSPIYRDFPEGTIYQYGCEKGLLLPRSAAFIPKNR